MFPFYNNYPGTDLHEIDLAYILKLCANLESNNKTLLNWKTTHEAEYQELKDKVDGLVNNLVDVISPWDSSIEYPIYSIVEYQGTNYIAVQNVPVGAMITNTDYWQPANTVVEQINAIGVTVNDVKDDVEELQYYITPEMYGAAGDGVTDDTAALSAALNAVSQHTGDENYCVLIRHKYLITEEIVVSGTGLMRIFGVDNNSSEIKCSGATAHIRFRGESTEHEIDIRDIRIRGDYTQTSPLLIFDHVFNIYLKRLYTLDAGQDSYGLEFLDSGIISCDECVIVGSNDVANYPAYSNGIHAHNSNSMFTFKGANIWNINTAFTFTGNCGQTNILNNWAECINNFVVRNIQSGEDGRYSTFQIEGNAVNIHTYLAFVPSVINLFKIIAADTSAKWQDSQVNFSHNTVYIATSESITMENNSAVNIASAPSAPGIINIFFDGNVFTGKTLTQLGAYVFISATTALYADAVRIRSARMTLRPDAARITDDTRIISDVIPALLSNRSGVSAPSGLYLNDGSTANDGRIAYASNAFYGYIGGTAVTMAKAGMKVVQISSTTVTTGSTGNVALGTSASTVHILAVTGDVDGIYTPFISNGNNFVHATTRSGADIANTSVTLQVFYTT